MTAELYVAKRDFRSMVWSQMERGKLLRTQRNSRQRLPFFVGSEEAAQKIADTEEFKNCQTIVINSDSAQEALRVLALKSGKSVFVPVAHVNYGGAFCQLVLPAEKEVSDELLTQTARAASNGAPADSALCRQITVEQMPSIDLFVVGSVAVSKQGYRIGQGDGHSDMDYAVIRTAGRINDSTLVFTCVHDEQVFDRLPGELFGPHDVAVDAIATPSTLLRVTDRLAKPNGIIWSLIVPNRVKPACVIRSLMQKQIDDGVDVKLSEEYGESGRDGWQGRYRGQGSRFRGRGGGRYFRRVFRPSRPPTADLSAGEGEVRPLMAQRDALQPVPLLQQQPEPESRARRQWTGRRRRANTAPTERSDDRAVRRRADEDCLVRLKLLPLEARRSDVRAALEALSLRATIQSFSMGHALLQLPSAETARRLADLGSLTVQGRSVPVRALTGSEQQQRRHCLHVHGTALSLPQLRHALARLGFDQVFARGTGPTSYSVEVPDQQTVDRLLAVDVQQMRSLLGDSITLSESRGRDTTERNTTSAKQSDKTTSSATVDVKQSADNSLVSEQENTVDSEKAHKAAKTVPKSVEKEHEKEQISGVAQLENKLDAIDLHGKITEALAKSDHSIVRTPEATNGCSEEKLTNGPIAGDSITLNEETPDGSEKKEESAAVVLVENGEVCLYDDEPAISDPAESAQTPSAEAVIQPRQEASDRPVCAAAERSCSASSQQVDPAAADQSSDTDSFTSAGSAAAAPLVNGHLSSPSGAGDSSQGTSRPADLLKDCPAPTAPLSGDAPADLLQDCPAPVVD